MKLYSVCGKGALRLLLQCSQGDSIQIVMASPEKTVNIVGAMFLHLLIESNVR